MVDGTSSRFYKDYWGRASLKMEDKLIVCEIIDKLSAYHILERSFKRL
jgi:hypothetical protein